MLLKSATKNDSIQLSKNVFKRSNNNLLYLEVYGSEQCLMESIITTFKTNTIFFQLLNKCKFNNKECTIYNQFFFCNVFIII